MPSITLFNLLAPHVYLGFLGVFILYRLQDRFHRFYWVLPRLGVPLVESIASSGLHNPAVNVDVTCRQDPPSIAGSLLFNLIKFRFA